MKEFNLDEYLKNPSQKVVTRDGREVRIICTDYKGILPIIALIARGEKEDINSFYENGRDNNTYLSNLDLFFATENKEHFNPNTLKPFDKVLARDNKSDIWVCNFFSHIAEDSTYPYVCIDFSFKKCIPYNDDTKHLVGTSDEAPEYYRYWEE